MEWEAEAEAGGGAPTWILRKMLSKSRFISTSVLCGAGSAAHLLQAGT